MSDDHNKRCAAIVWMLMNDNIAAARFQALMTGDYQLSARISGAATEARIAVAATRQRDEAGRLL